MTRPRNDRLNYVSLDIFRMRQIASTKTDEEFGKWCRKAIDDLSVGCIGEDVDEDVRNCYEHARERHIIRQEQNAKCYQAKKNGAASASTEIAPVNGSKRNDQDVYGQFANVYLSKEEYNTLLTSYGNINLLKKVIEAFSSSLADGNAKSNNHFATLTRWIEARKKWDADKAEGHETFQEREGRRQVEQLRRFGLIK